MNGENIKKNECTFRMCLLLAKYFHELGYEPIQIRQAIFDWGKKNNVYIRHNVNDMIRMAINDETKLSDRAVYINSSDISEIVKRFDKKNIRLCALAILLYAKAHENGELNFAQEDFAKWVCIQQPHLSAIFEELELFGYIERTKASSDEIFAWNGRVIGKRTKYRIKIPYENEGDFKVEDNNVCEIYSRLF